MTAARPPAALRPVTPAGILAGRLAALVRDGTGSGAGRRARS